MSNSKEIPSIVADGPLPDSITSLLGDRVKVHAWDTVETVKEKPVTGIYVFGHPHLDGKMIDRFPSLKVISNYGVGVDHISVQDATARNIPVGNTPNVLNGATADMAFSLVLAVGRRLAEGDRHARGPDFTVYDSHYMLGTEVHGTTIGIIGLGRIGQQIARRAHGFDMRVIYHNRRRNESAEQTLGVHYVEFDEILAQSDYLVLSTPLTDQTTGLIGRNELERMKSTAALINVSRGPVVDTNALTKALSDRQIYAAGLDVTDPEPLPRDHPLLSLDNVTITPHLGSATVQTRSEMARVSVENLLRGLRDEPLLHEVT